MALSLNEAQALASCAWMKDRIKTAISTYCAYLLNTPPSDPNYTNIVNVARQITTQQQQATDSIAFGLSGDIEFQTAGGGIDDNLLKVLVEKQIRSMFPIPPAPVPGQAGMYPAYPPPPAPIVPPPATPPTQ